MPCKDDAQFICFSRTIYFDLIDTVFSEMDETIAHFFISRDYS